MAIFNVSLSTFCPVFHGENENVAHPSSVHRRRNDHQPDDHLMRVSDLDCVQCSVLRARTWRTIEHNYVATCTNSSFEGIIFVSCRRVL